MLLLVVMLQALLWVRIVIGHGYPTRGRQPTRGVATVAAAAGSANIAQQHAAVRTVDN
jgi:hypothetical protein